jgi:hypothetical protein
MSFAATILGLPAEARIEEDGSISRLVASAGRPRIIDACHQRASN